MTIKYRNGIISADYSVLEMHKPQNLTARFRGAAAVHSSPAREAQPQAAGRGFCPEGVRDLSAGAARPEV